MVFASPRHYMLLSTAAAVATIVLKTLAWRLTGSVGLLSDAMESGVNLIAAIGAFWALTLAAKPADRRHHYGHFKAEYFSSGLESVLIVVAALAIIHAAIGRLQEPQPLEQVGIGLAISLLATALNGLVAWVLLKAARRFDSITLRADAHHLLTDVWTSTGVVVGIGLVKFTGLTILDPLIAIAVAVNISPTKRITSQPARWRTSCINGVSSNGSSGTSAPPSKAMSRAASSVAVSSTSSTVTMPSTLSSALTTGMMVRA